MKSTLVTLQAEFEANDAGELKKKVAALTAENTKLKNASTTVVEKAKADPEAIKAAEQRGFERAKKKLTRAAEREAKDQIIGYLNTLRSTFQPIKDELENLLILAKDQRADLDKHLAFEPSVQPVKLQSKIIPAARLKTVAAAVIKKPDTGLKGPEQKILNSVETWLAMGHDSPSNAQVAWLAGYSPSSTSYTNPRGALKSKGLISYPQGDRVSITDDGRVLATQIELSGRKLIDFVCGQLPGPERKILQSIAANHPHVMTNEQAASGADYSHTSTSYTNPRGALKSKELITYPQPDHVLASEWLFQETP
jgi:hypothetical protein